MMRVLHVIGAMDRAGAETAVMNWYRNVDRDRLQFDFLVHEEHECDYDQEIRELGGLIHRVPRFTGLNLVSYRKAVGKVLDEHPEYAIVHGHIGSSAAVYLSEAKKRGRVAIAHSHSQKLSDFKQRIMFDSVSYPTRFIADDFLACSIEAGLARFGKWVVGSDRFHVIANGVNLDEYACDPDEHNRAKERFGWSRNVVMGHVGRFVYEKNHEFLLRVFAEFRKKEPRGLLVLVGKGELEEELRAFAAQLGVSDAVCFFGSTDSVPAVLKAFDVFVFPSFHEGLAIAAIEAQACGIPCVLSEGLPESACIAQSNKRLSLGAGPVAWATAAVRLLAEPQDRLGSCELVRRAGFDAASTALWLSDHYDRLIASH